MDKTFLDIIRKVILQETIYLRHYIGQVKSTDDLMQKGRVCVAVYDLGVFSEAKGFWCSPRDKNALITPAVGDWVEVYFINGDIDRPVYLGIAAEMKDMIPKNYKSKNTHVLFESNGNELAAVYDSAANELSVGKTDMQPSARKTDPVKVTFGIGATITATATGVVPGAVVLTLTAPTDITGTITDGSDQVKVGKK